MPFLYNICPPSGYRYYYPPNIINTNLVLYVNSRDPLSGGSNTVWNDISGNGNNMTLSNTTFSTGSGYVFNGTNSYAMTPNMKSYYAASNQTQEVWIKTSNNGVIISELGQASINSGWHDSQLEVVGGKPYFGVWNSLLYSTSSSTSVNTNTWFYLCWRYNGTTSTLDGFVNGVKITPSLSTGRSLPPSAYYSALGAIDGTNMGSGTYYNGQIAIYRMYNRVLTDSEVLQNYNAQKSLFGY